jgi:hypothetical protein
MKSNVYVERFILKDVYRIKTHLAPVLSGITSGQAITMADQLTLIALLLYRNGSIVLTTHSSSFHKSKLYLSCQTKEIVRQFGKPVPEKYMFIMSFASATKRSIRYE